jgi:hypothetical protein
MAIDGKVLTGCIIRLSVTPRGGQNVVIGQAMSLAITEQYQVRPVFGIGRLTAQELPILSYAGVMSVNQYAIDNRAAQNVLNQFDRMGSASVPDLDSWVNQLLYSEGVDLTVIRKSKVNGVVQDQTVAKISGAICTGESTSISENQIVMRDGSFIFAEPVKV